MSCNLSALKLRAAADSTDRPKDRRTTVRQEGGLRPSNQSVLKVASACLLASAVAKHTTRQVP